MRQSRAVTYLLLLSLVIVSLFSPTSLVRRVQADSPYTLNPVPAYAQEGHAVSLVLTVKFNPVASTTSFVFRFSVKDPAGTSFQSQLINYTTVPGQDQFSVIVAYPGISFSGINSLAGQYLATVDQFAPVAMPTVASSSFILGLTDNPSYERTQTVNIQGSGYNASELVGVTIKTQTTSTIVFSDSVFADFAGMVTDSWKIPVNGAIDNYVVTLTGSSTVKTPPDAQTFSVRAAIMSISGIASIKSTYQRTQTMKFSFQPVYPDGSIPTTGVGLLTLARPTNGNVTLTATYDSMSQTFNASYTTSISNETGIWTATLTGHAYSDAFGNAGPGLKITNSPQLTTANLSIIVTANTSIGVGQQLKLNATIAYPDGTFFQSGAATGYLLFSGTPIVNDSIPMVFDTNLRQWIGTYTVRSSDTGGLWSLVVRASDLQSPSNSGSATRAITVQNNPPASFPLYYFGIIAAIIAGLLITFFLVFKRRRVTHTSLKIDLDAVHSEAGRIESSEFFQSVKDQVRKEKEE
jgi:hypothetical protein